MRTLLLSLKQLNIKVPKYVCLHIISFFPKKYNEEFKYGWEVIKKYSLNNIFKKTCKTQNIVLLEKCFEEGHICDEKSAYYVYKNYSNELTKAFLKKIPDDLPISNYALKGACRNNNQQIISKHKLLKNVDYNYGLFGACKGGHIDLAKKMINYGAFAFDVALLFACLGENEKMIKFVLTKPIMDINLVLFDYIAKSYEKRNTVNYDIIEILIEAGANRFNNILCYGADVNNKEIIDLMIDLGANFFDGGLKFACKNNNETLIDFFIEKKANLQDGFEGACMGGHLDLAKKIYGTGLIEYDEFLFEEMSLACEYGHKNIVDFLIEIHTNYAIYDYGLEGACKGNNMEMVEYMIKCGTTNFDYGLKGACDGNNIEMAKLMIEYGANDFEEVIKWCDLRGDLKKLIKQHL